MTPAPAPSPRQVVVARVRNEEDLFVPVSLIGQLRLYVVSGGYILLIASSAITLGIVAVALILRDKPYFQFYLDHMGGLAGLFTGSGTLGWLLLRADQKEREHVRCDRLLETLIKMPNTSTKEQSLVDLVKHMTQKGSFF